MPTVPQVTGPTIAPAPLPGARVTPNAPLESFGGGAATPQGPDLSGPIRLVQQVWEHEQQKADQVALLDADNRAWESEKQHFRDPKTGAFNVHGKAAIDAGDAALDKYGKDLSDIEATLSNDRQKAAFRQRVQARMQSVDAQLQEHVATERQRYSNEQYAAGVANRTEEAAQAVNDPIRVKAIVDEQVALVTDNAKQQGLPDEERDRQITKVKSSTYSTIIESLLAKERDTEASAYFEQHKSEFTAEDRTRIEKALDEGTLRGDAQRRTDAITEGGTTHEQALEEARQIPEPKLRDEVRRRVNEFYSEQNAVRREQQDQLYLQATNVVDAQPGRPARSVISADLWAKLDLSQRAALERRSEDVTNDDQRWITFLNIDPRAMGDMTKHDFEVAYWSHFDQQHRARAESLWLASKEAARSGKFDTEHLTSTLTFKDRVDDAIRSSHGTSPALIDPNKKPSSFSKVEAANYAAFEQEAAKRVEEFELTKLGGKRKATGEEMQTIIDNLTIERVFVKKSWASDPQQFAWQVTTDQRGRSYVPYATVPIADRNAIERDILDHRTKVNNDKVQRAYAAYVLNDLALYQSIISER